MNDTFAKKPGFWQTVRLLLGVARKRGLGRTKRQRDMLRNRSGGRSFDMGQIGFVLTAGFMVIINVFAALSARIAVDAGERLQIQRQGKIAVSSRFYREATRAQREAEDASPPIDRSHVPLDYFSEARRISDDYGGDQEAIEKKLRVAFEQHGTKDLIPQSKLESFTLTNLATSGPLPAMSGGAILFGNGSSPIPPRLRLSSLRKCCRPYLPALSAGVLRYSPAFCTRWCMTGLEDCWRSSWSEFLLPSRRPALVRRWRW